ncbi:hypothetical protein A3A20_00350 [Candidatus Wolfebacteria bacterium RIFCSPLOWO2_01_FULL_45_19]|uniref:Uncharacterized protein n=1 Tax=Candidatus Wolfebacteria bacterium RIFCSPLOWO2_01_FULL_45_19 TaxID=1802557 RepID=A0A1F8DQX2_9BACT|nr:MAG: hypothetical protein UX23_C0014G0008 [Parcubacteria group bacterium GW2011_GWB1_45_9]OGM91017.1 MAG: hypothetical protein A3A20_00350 [Candidatus Wolfebacteria bacterium RIFCSPLOWO2_01_FULL_45_19]
MNKHWPFFAAIFVFVAGMALLILISLQKTGGVFAYALDDIYIHMAISKNLALNGAWGINAGEFSSSASSILYPLIIAASFVVFGVNEISPLAINIIFGLLSILAAYFILKKTDMPPAWTFAALLFFVFATPFFIVALTGLEHMIQIAVFLFFVYLATRAIASEKPSGKEIAALALLAAILTSVRYESMFVLFVVCGLFILKKQWNTAFVLGAIGMLPIVIFGLYAVAQGSYFFPNPVLLKAKFEHFAIWDLMKLGYYALSNMAESHILLLLAGALSAFAMRVRNHIAFWSQQQLMVVIFAATTLLHLTFAQTGWFYRYEAYLVALGIIIVSTGIYEYFRNKDILAMLKLKTNPLFFGTLVAIFFALSLPYVFRAGSAVATPQAMKNIYEQHYQLGLFIQKYYGGETIVANDIGFISFLPNAYIIDWVGLGNVDVTRARRNGNFTREWMEDYARSKNAKLAVMHDVWFANTGVPQSWTKIGEWKVTSGAPFIARNVAFYSTDRNEIEGLRQYFADFSANELPNSVEATKYF